ncbi:glutathione S-transferase [Psychrobacter sp. HD31]|uniref:glutathione S-transferase n=1 Tax=Psychrobacter sp. HD31 TaxID=3112003 RepID=UPI003DA32AD4
MMLHLHHLENSRSLRIAWLLEELNLDYKLTVYQRTKANLAPKSLEKIHPMGKAPILEVDDKALAESGFIIDYLLKHHDTKGTLKPNDGKAWEDYTYWFHFAESSAMPNLVMRLIFSKVVERSPLVIRPVAKKIQASVEESMISGNINKMLDLMDQHLSANKWFAGNEFTAADIQMYLVGVGANARNSLDKTKYANILNWLKRCESRDAFLKAVDKAGKLDF